jgi:hypothetical protein
MLARRRGRRVAPTLLLASALLAACKGQAHRAAPPPTIVDAAPAIDARPAPGGWFPDDASIAAHVELASLRAAATATPTRPRPRSVAAWSGRPAPSWPATTAT